jgi:hypothetical protein
MSGYFGGIDGGVFLLLKFLPPNAGGIMALTDLQVRAAKPKEKDYKLSDADGLFLLVTKTGSRLWRLKYRYAGKEKLLALGKYPEVSLADARERRFEARKNWQIALTPEKSKRP